MNWVNHIYMSQKHQIDKTKKQKNSSNDIFQHPL